MYMAGLGQSYKFQQEEEEEEEEKEEEEEEEEEEQEEMEEGEEKEKELLCRSHLIPDIISQSDRSVGTAPTQV